MNTKMILDVLTEQSVVKLRATGSRVSFYHSPYGKGAVTCRISNGNRHYEGVSAFTANEAFSNALNKSEQK